MSQAALSIADLSIDIPAPLAEEIRAAAEARDHNVACWHDDDVAEDMAALADFEKTGMGVPWDEVRAWMKSWGTAKELPRPAPRKLR